QFLLVGPNASAPAPFAFLPPSPVETRLASSVRETSPHRSRRPAPCWRGCCAGLLRAQRPSSALHSPPSAPPTIHRDLASANVPPSPDARTIHHPIRAASAMSRAEY